MKLILKILGILILILIISMVSIPYFFRNQIVEKLKLEINENVNAQIDFVDFDLSLFRSFPNFDFQLQGLSVINKTPFEGDTLAYIPSFGLSLDLMSVFKGDTYKVCKIAIGQARINALVDADGAANWDIAIESQTAEGGNPENAEADNGDPFSIELQSIVISDARIVYDDKSLATYALLEGLNHRSSGDFTLDYTTLKTHTSIKALTVNYDDITYLNKTNAALDANIGADLANAIYTLEDNQLRLNQLFVRFDGSVGMQANDDINLMLTYASVDSDFKNFLSLIPAVYSKDFESLTTSGTLALNGNVKGIYNDASYPAFALSLLVNDGFFQYPGLPAAVRNVNITTRIDFPGGDFDNLRVDIPRFEMDIAGGEISASLHIKKPMSVLDIKGAINANMDLAKIKNFYPLEEGDALSGKITANVSFEGNIAALENQEYNSFKFLGSLLVEDLNYASTSLPQAALINNAQLNFSPEYLDLVNFNLKIGNNDIAAKGRIENFMPYALADGVLKGRLETTSTYLNIGELMAETSADESTVPMGETPKASNEARIDTTAMAAVEIPGNIDFTLTANFKEVIYDSIVLSDMMGEIVIKDKIVNLNKLSMGILDGRMEISGNYNSQNLTKPKAAMTFAIQDIDIKTAYHTFGVFQKFAPIAQKTDGRFSTTFALSTLLDRDLMPIYTLMNGEGNLQTTAITVENVNSIDKLADIIKMPALKSMKLSPVGLSFELIEGKLHVKPFDIKYKDMKINIAGWTSLDQKLNYDMVLSVPRDKFGGEANALLNNLVNEANRLGTNFSLGETVNLKAAIVGNIDEPQVKIVPGEGSGKNIVDDLKKKAQEEIDKQKQKLEEQARREMEKNKAEAGKEADKIIADAEKQANQIIAEAQKQADAINKTARESAEQVKEEAQKQADKMMAEAKKKGSIAEIATKATTEKLLKEANDEADTIVKEANGKSEEIMKTAREKAAKIKADAQTRADKLLE